MLSASIQYDYFWGFQSIKSFKDYTQKKTTQYKERDEVKCQYFVEYTSQYTVDKLVFTLLGLLNLNKPIYAGKYGFKKRKALCVCTAHSLGHRDKISSKYL